MWIREITSVDRDMLGFWKLPGHYTLPQCGPMIVSPESKTRPRPTFCIRIPIVAGPTRPLDSSNQASKFIEWLMVIATTAILAALLLLSLVRAKAEATKVRCLNHYRQFGIRRLLDIHDNRELLPSTTSTTEASAPASTRGRARVSRTTPTPTSTPPTSSAAWASPATGPRVSADARSTGRPHWKRMPSFGRGACRSVDTGRLLRLGKAKMHRPQSLHFQRFQCLPLATSRTSASNVAGGVWPTGSTRWLTSYFLSHESGDDAISP